MRLFQTVFPIHLLDIIIKKITKNDMTNEIFDVLYMEVVKNWRETQTKNNLIWVGNFLSSRIKFP